MVFFSRIEFIPFLVLLVVLTLSTLGLIILYSTSGGIFASWPLKQLYAMAVFIPLMIIIQYIPIKYIYNFSYHIYFLSITLLILAEFLGYSAMGAQRWIKIGPFNLQPSEMSKIATILALARYFHSINHEDVSKLKNLIVPSIIGLIPVFLIIKQPNLGTAFILLVIISTIFFIAGVSLRKFGIVIILLLVSIPLVWNNMHDYQKRRVKTFINPDDDILGAGYNIIQSKIAIGSGGIHGKGLLNGTQTQLSFLPEKHTDFIFTVLAEELGFIGVALTIALYSLLFLLFYWMGLKCQNFYGTAIIFAILSMIFIHFIINTAMISGLIPVVGTPLPFLSYARSNTAISFMSVGIAMSCYRYRSKKRLR